MMIRQNFLKASSIKGLRVQHQGATGELLSETFLPSWGKFLVNGFHEKMEAAASLLDKPEASDIEIDMERSKFSVSSPGNCRIFSNAKKIWSYSEDEAQRVLLSWVKPPEQIQIVYPNNEKICLNFEKTNFFRLSIPTVATLFLITAFFFHLGVIAFGSLALKKSKASFSRQETNLDISKMQVGLAKLSSAISDSSTESLGYSHVAAAKKLLDSLTVGRSIKNANQILKPVALTKHFASGSEKLNTWTLDTVKTAEEIPLNISDAEIAEALRPAYSRLKDCYDDILVRDSNLKGKPELILEISTAGLVRNVLIQHLLAKESSIAALRSCFLKAYAPIHLPKPNQDFAVTHTLVLDY